MALKHPRADAQARTRAGKKQRMQSPTGTHPQAVEGTNIDDTLVANSVASNSEAQSTPFSPLSAQDAELATPNLSTVTESTVLGTDMPADVQASQGPDKALVMTTAAGEEVQTNDGVSPSALVELPSTGGRILSETSVPAASKGAITDPAAQAMITANPVAVPANSDRTKPEATTAETAHIVQEPLLPSPALPSPGLPPTVVFQDIDYVPQEVVGRLQNISRFREVMNNRYSLMAVPRTADWGRTPRLEKMLCLGGKPVLIWMIGRVRSLWFYDRNGSPHLRVNLGITLHSQEDQAAVQELFGRSRPRSDTVHSTIYAGRICSQREKGEYCDTATAFTQVYDATARLTAKSAMPQLTPVDLGKNDIVIVECNLTCWKRAVEGKAKKSWSTFDVGFELLSIFLLYSAPADLEEGAEVSGGTDISVEL